MTYAIEPQPIATVKIDGSDQLFPVQGIYCVGRNYAAHAIEMGHDPDREPPFFFQKSPEAVQDDGADFPYPAQSSNVHFEIELVVALKSGGTDISPDQALDHVYGYGVGLDMTRRDLQGAAKKMGRPWEAGKSFAHSAPCSALVPTERIGHPAAGAIWLDVNGTRRQEGDLNQLIWKVPEVIAELSKLFTLKSGDLIFTGTPAGVGAIERGDEMQGGIDGIGCLQVKVI